LLCRLIKLSGQVVHGSPHLHLCLRPSPSRLQIERT
jgi:hypothetical protein